MRIRTPVSLIPLFAAAWGVIAPVEALPFASPPLAKYVDTLPVPPRIVANHPSNVFAITISEFAQKLHRDLPPTTVWGYNGSYPGPTIEARRYTPVNITYINELFAPTLLGRLPVDQTLHLWDAPPTELPLEGTTELWEVVNLTGDTHPIHLHLVHFQVLNRQPFDVDAYLQTYELANPILPVPSGGTYTTVPVTDFLSGSAMPPDPNEEGWKDTVRMNPGEVTRILVRFAPTDVPASSLEGRYPFDPAEGPGYVWHCHILSHEDNEMMRPMLVRSLQ